MNYIISYSFISQNSIETSCQKNVALKKNVYALDNFLYILR